MPEADVRRCRLCLVTPPDIDPDRFLPLLDDALAGGDIASLILTGDGERLERLARPAVLRAQARGVAVLVANDIGIAARTGADGVHIDTGPAALAEALAGQAKGLIVGAGGIRSRHDAMVAGERGPDYLFFGRLDGDTGEGIFAKALDLAAWWAELFVIPAVVMGGRSVASVEAAARAGVEFVALSRAVFEAAAGPARAVAEANRLLAAATEAVA
jgi:thiamine-phosphate pyrophosphorylase